MASLTVENYLKAIYQLADGDLHRTVSTGQIAEALSVSPGTVTSMLKTLAESSLASYKPYEGVQLTPVGRALALRVIRRHRLIELFLVQTLELSWDEVHEEAEHMEHAVSDWLVDRIEQHLGHPKFDPHGDPIPAADGEMTHAAAIPLAELSAGRQFRVVRVVDQSPEFLRELSESGIAIGVSGSVAEVHADGGQTIELDGDQQHLDSHVASHVYVDETRDAPSQP
ncbi:metal-dependent transcriptional regulator [Aeoliella mucimassa]|uniref:Transcriptional regulator MntR n=1 Tax=Aeoliella mucimassa TaxID=2527972 RepID=A0A518ATV9_9BACT|nr:metal-dependent transcriptional regulator [Aeoliella mucimassa]QDU58159.1 Iron-dependent repressor IdeR [Aeoliella mucimassa]